MRTAGSLWLSALLALAGTAGCVGSPAASWQVPPVQADATGALAVVVKFVSLDRRIAAVVADVEQIVVEVIPREAFPTSPGEPRPKLVKSLDKATLSAGPANVTFASVRPGFWEIKLTALDASSRVIGSVSRETSVTSGQAQQVSLALQLEPTLPSGGVGSLNPSFTFAVPLPTAGVMTWSQATGFLSGPIVGFDAAGATCLIGTTRYDANGQNVGSLNLQPPPSGQHPLIDSVGQAWVIGTGQIFKFGLDGKELGRYPAAVNSSVRVRGIDPTGRIWFQSGDTELTRMAPDGTVLGKHTVLTGDEGWLQDDTIEFDPQSGDGWILSGARLLKVSASGALLFTVSFPAPTALGPTQSADALLQASAVDRAGNLWVARQDGQLFKVGTGGQILGQYPGPFNVGWLLCDHNGDLWAVSATLSEHNLTKYSMSGVAIGRNGTGFIPGSARVAPDGTIWLVRGEDTGNEPLPRLARLTP